MWDLPGPGIKSVSPALAGGFSITVPPGKSIVIPFLEQKTHIQHSGRGFIWSSCLWGSCESSFTFGGKFFLPFDASCIVSTNIIWTATPTKGNHPPDNNQSGTRQSRRSSQLIVRRLCFEPSFFFFLVDQFSCKKIVNFFSCEPWSSRCET